MGFFGRSKNRKDAGADRCMECGMTGGRHTGWCPSAAEMASPEPTEPEATTLPAPDPAVEAGPEDSGTAEASPG